MISYNGVWLELKDIERITSENSGPLTSEPNSRSWQ